ncbi:zinc-binding dehydrogenase [Anoxybacterium hadale]|uniref:Zinc-binding dehydrogenase n=1 Tax=Anoxybacterium hadale TaxID=3408580 RepID=A0ACD1A7B9_9FIRM|nr:zinc-binding dehydrogenase [Clostridiales bacterium]
MKALFLTGKSQVEYRETPTPACPEDGLLLIVEAVGLCGSDIRTYTHGHSQVSYPCILGHENAGVVVAVGANAPGNYKIGDALVVHPAVPCGTCYYCRNGMESICENLIVVGSGIPGGFAQYMVIPKLLLEKGTLIRMPEGISFDRIVIAELLGSVIRAQKQLDIGLGETVVIIGTGPIGCLHSEIARLRGASRIILINHSAGRLELARNHSSGTHFINSSEEDPVKKVLELTDGRGADAVISASPSTEAVAQGLKMLRKEGRLSVFGGFNKEAPELHLDGNLIHYRRLSIIGAYSYSAADFEQGVKLIAEGRINTDLVTHHLPLKEMEKGVELIQSGKALKVVLLPQEE